jgi:hypothetical protein
MKYVKMLGLAAVAAAALMAFVGSSTASATVLCATTPVGEVCPTGWAASEIHATTTEKPKLTSTFKTVECDESTVSGSITTEGGNSSTASGAASLSFTGHCNCTVVVASGGTLEVHAIAGTNNGTVTSNNATVTIQCSTIFGAVHCNYVTNNKDIGTLVGGETATMNITIKIEEESTSGLCDPEATWHGNYSVTTPMGLWVARETGDV